MKKYGTLREYLEKYKIHVKKLTIRTSDSYYKGIIPDSLLDNYMYSEPNIYIDGTVCLYVQD